MEVKLSVNFNWDIKNVSDEHISVLEREAIDRISYMLKQGYNSGELHAVISDNDYWGSWSVDRENAEPNLIHDFLYKMHIKEKISLTDVAQKIGVHKSTLSRVLSGEIGLSSKTVKAMCGYLNNFNYKEYYER